MTRWRATRAEISLDAIRHNCRTLRSLLRPGTKQCAVVKADAYGHGDIPVARACLEAGVEYLAVSYIEEGVRLREAGIEAPILVLVEPPRSAAKDVIAWNLTPSVSNGGAAAALAEAAESAGTVHGLHLCIDTGMHREGAEPGRAPEVARQVADSPHLRLEGAWSHLAVADEEHNPATDEQIASFTEALAALESDGVTVPLRHLANSAGLMGHPGSRFDMVRAGIATYGLYPAGWLESRADLKPAMRVVSEVCAVRRVKAGDGVSYGLTYTPSRDATIASVALGYADGFSRLLSGDGEVLIGGRRRRVAGRVTMDQVMADCGDDEVRVGDEVVIIGRQGNEEITAGEVATKIGTIHYEVCCAVSKRVPREYSG